MEKLQSSTTSMVFLPWIFNDFSLCKVTLEKIDLTNSSSPVISRFILSKKVEWLYTIPLFRIIHFRIFASFLHNFLALLILKSITICQFTPVQQIERYWHMHIRKIADMLEGGLSGHIVSNPTFKRCLVSSKKKLFSA